LDGVSSLLPDTALFLYQYIRREAVLSSQIEGTQSSLSDLLLFEIDETPGVPTDDVAEVSRYVRALEVGLARIRDGLPLSGRLFQEVHGTLLSAGRGADKLPGEYRRSQVWLGGPRPALALFVPPPPQLIAESMAELERFLNDVPERTPTLLKAALAHVQFETIHPFLDGNGRVGRLLITLLLVREGALAAPLLYLSLYLKQNRSTYYELLQRVRTESAWEDWLAFFVEGVRVTAEGAVASARAIAELFGEDREKIRRMGRIAGSAMLVHDALVRHPIQTNKSAVERSGLSAPTVIAVMKKLDEAGIVREMTGKQRYRIFGYAGYLAILGEGTKSGSA
ncbi:MAG: Fic family protein, partial [Planctomycetota bacterium]